MKPPLVSILTPSFNQAEWLQKNIYSVQRQSYQPIEHIITDGGSSDGTKDILERAPSTVRYWSEPDRGQSEAINKAFSRSRGEIIGWINSDDAYVHPQAVRWVVDAFEDNPTVDVVYGHAAVVGAKNELLHLKWVPRFSRRLLLVYNFLIQPAVFIRRSSIANERLVDDTLQYTMDRALWLQLAHAGRRFLRLNRVVAVDRLHAARKSESLERIWTERAPLDATYRAPTGPWTSGARWILHIASRVNGLLLVPQVYDANNFIENKPSYSEIIVQQIARRRRTMKGRP